MKAQFKIDFETFMMANQTKYTQYFEGQTYSDTGNHIYVKFIPIAVRRPSINCEQHEVIVRFHINAVTSLKGDQIVDELSTLLSEKTISNMEFRALETFQRANKFDLLYETIADIKMYHWGTPDASVDTLS